MAAGEWVYQGISRISRDDSEFVAGTDLYRIEARRAVGVSDIDAPDGVVLRDYVRLQMIAEWDQNSQDQFSMLRMTVDGVTVYESLSGAPLETADTSENELHTWITPDSDLLRSVPFRRLFSQASAELLVRSQVSDQVPADAVPGFLPDFREMRSEWPKGDTRQVARWAGYVYATAVADGQPANKAVEEAFGVSRTTAKRMVTLARELGFLADSVVGAPGPSTRKG
ncbi:hypothetical protein [Corynebacterium glyciniphilum]|uniref:hypothetical protein n=1 Tax=Corynebacterium glyciniphilum TaxID=1404244 RepID=UPI003DA040C4